MHEPTLIRTLSERKHYDAFHQHVKEYAVTPEAFELIEDIGAYFETFLDEDTVAWDKLEAWAFIHQHPTWTSPQRVAYSTMVENVAKHSPDPAVANRLLELTTALDIKELADEAVYKGGTDALVKVGELVDTYRQTMTDGGHEDPLAPYDLNEIFKSLMRDGGLNWRLTELNKSVGPVCKGDFILVAKRPEVGGTTFLTSEFTHMVQQLPEGARAIIFNNEESKHKVVSRLIQSGLNRTVMDMVADPSGTLEDWSLFLGTKSIDVIHDTSLSVRTVESLLKRRHYDLIGFNVMWKIQGWRKLEEFQRYNAISLWGRSIADRYAPVIGIWQADGSAEGVPWLTMNQLYGSKTGVQGEADVLVMIGSSHEPGKGNERYISVVKNKIPTSKVTDPRLRHGLFTVDLDSERGRFVSRMKP